MIIKICQHPVTDLNSFKSSKLKEQLNEHGVKVKKVLAKPFEDQKFVEHIVVEQTVEDLI